MEDLPLDALEALKALRDAGTTGRAAARLRLTQSAVSKRLSTLEARLGAALLEPHGREVRLTPAALRLLDEAAPLLARLRDVVAQAREPAGATTLRVAASESLLSSWLPEALARALPSVSGLALELHAHRGPVLLERVLAGDYALAICVAAGAPKDLVARDLGAEAMVVVPSGLVPPPRSGALPVLTIEEKSLTWRALAPRLRSRSPPCSPALEVVGRLESFTALAQVARAGLGNALVPEGVALALGIPPRALIRVKGLTRPLGAFARTTTARRADVTALLDALGELPAAGGMRAPARARTPARPRSSG